MQRDQLSEALRDAFRAHVAVLFGNMCVGMSEETMQGGAGRGSSRIRFGKGLAIAVAAHDFAQADVKDVQ